MLRSLNERGFLTLAALAWTLPISVSSPIQPLHATEPAALSEKEKPTLEWSNWRGPFGNGTALPDANPPATWAEGKNVRWKVEIPGRGSASPIVVGDRIFVVTAIPKPAATPKPEAEDGSGNPQDPPAEGGRRGRGGRGGGNRDAIAEHAFVVIALDRKTGKKLWERVATETTPHQGHHDHHGFATASPMSDGERVYTFFGSRGLFAYTLDGEPLWSRTDLGRMETRNGFGEGASPTIHGDTIILPWDHEGPSWVAAIDAKTGKNRWKVDRDETTTWATPLVVDHAGKKQVVLSAEKFVRSYDFTTGEELWRCSGQTSRPVASPVANGGLVYVGSGFRGAFLAAFRLDGKGDVGGTDAVVWSVDKSTPDVPSLLLSGDRLYFLSRNSNILSCHDAKTGKPIYSNERVPGLGDLYSSPVAAAGRVYLTGRNGTTVVIEDGGTAPKVIATNVLDDPIDATAAIAGKELFLRGSKHLYCIAE
jgi:outer membrane protein assembly factor BamB